MDRDGITTIGMYFETKFIGPSNTKGARIKATFYHYDGSKTMLYSSYQYELDSHDNHLFALKNLLDTKLTELYNGYTVKFRAEVPHLPASFLWQVVVE
jgi:hypothetical protein